MIRTLVLKNADATPKDVIIRCDTQSVQNILAWYGAYFSGDRYTVALDGRNIPMDQNGEPASKFFRRNQIFMPKRVGSLTEKGAVFLGRNPLRKAIQRVVSERKIFRWKRQNRSTADF